MQSHYGYLTPKRNTGSGLFGTGGKDFSERKVGHVSLSKGQYLTLQKRQYVTGICKQAGLVDLT